MNILLFAPGLLVLLLDSHGVLGTIPKLAICALSQLLLAVPFLLTNPVGYLARSFNLGRQFFFKWTVNWRFLPNWMFHSRYFHVLLVLLHIGFLIVFLFYKWKGYVDCVSVKKGYLIMEQLISSYRREAIRSVV